MRLRRIFTEEDAKEKWCPQAYSDTSVNRCIGSECMWWVWIEYYDQETNIRTIDTCGCCGAIER